MLLKFREEGSTEEVEVRPTKQWVDMMSDYKYLSGEDSSLPKRQTRASAKARVHPRFSMPPTVRRCNDLVCCCCCCVVRLICVQS